MIKKLLVTFVLLFPVTLFAQNTTTSGTITLQAASCAGASAGYVYYILPTNTSAVAVTISGTWSATLQFVGSVNGTTWTSVNATPIPTASAVTSTTANGTWTINPAGLAEVCVYASSYASGKAVINASVSTASTAANGSAGGDLSGSYPNPTVVALNGSPLPANSFGALTNSGNGTLSYVPPFAVDITQPPYNAKCDGSTDDHVAIQAALDANFAIYIPTSQGGITQCNLGTVGITLCSPSNPSEYNIIYGNYQFFGYSGSGSAITFSGACNSATVTHLQVDGTGSTGSPKIFDIEGEPGTIGIDGIEDTGFPADYVSIYTATGVYQFTVANYSSDGALELTDDILDSFVNTGFGSMALTSVSQASFTNMFLAIDTGYSSTITNSTNVTFNGAVALYGNLTFSGTNTLNGNISYTSSAQLSGPFVGQLNAFNSSSQLDTWVNGLQTNLLYSVAGTPLPTCNSGLSGTQLQVSDALVPTFLGTYTGSGTVHSPVICNGSNWVTY